MKSTLLPSDLSAPVMDVLQGLGWRWAMASSDTGEWFKFKACGMCDGRQGEEVWVKDLETAKNFAGEETVVPNVWEPTPELRYWKDLLWCDEPRLQQKWRGRSWGKESCTEWRNVPTVDSTGREYV